MRDTSGTSYEAIQRSGALSRMRWLVYDALYRMGPLTAAELTRKIQKERGGREHYHKRLSELERLGVVRECEIRRCQITGHEVLTWDVTSALPRPPSKQPGKPSKAEIVVAMDEIAAAFVKLKVQPSGVLEKTWNWFMQQAERGRMEEPQQRKAVKKQRPPPSVYETN